MIHKEKEGKCLFWQKNKGKNL